jgi:hypothetical protein
MLGITSVPSAPSAERKAEIKPVGPPSIGFTFEKAV